MTVDKKREKAEQDLQFHLMCECFPMDKIGNVLETMVVLNNGEKGIVKDYNARRKNPVIIRMYGEMHAINPSLIKTVNGCKREVPKATVVELDIEDIKITPCKNGVKVTIK